MGNVIPPNLRKFAGWIKHHFQVPSNTVSIKYFSNLWRITTMNCVTCQWYMHIRQSRHWHTPSCNTLFPISLLIRKRLPWFVTRNMTTRIMSSQNTLRNYIVLLPYNQLFFRSLQFVSQLQICCNLHALCHCEVKLDQIFLHDVTWQLAEEFHLPGMVIGLDSTGYASWTINKQSCRIFCLCERASLIK